MHIRQIYTDSPLRNFSYLIQSEDGSVNVTVDPYDARQIEAELAGAPLTHIVNTHEHHDHTCGNAALLKRYRPEVLGHAGARASIPGFTRALAAGDRIPLDSNKGQAQAWLECLDTPGHTMSHICLLAVETGTPRAVFTGDTLFNAGVGNCRGGGDPEALYATIRDQFHSMPDEIHVYPGHEYMGNNLRFTLEYEPGNDAARQLLEEYEARRAEGDWIVASIAREREVNCFFRLRSPGVHAGLRRAGMLAENDSPSDDRQIFLALRRLRDRW